MARPVGVWFVSSFPSFCSDIFLRTLLPYDGGVVLVCVFSPSPDGIVR